MGKLLETSLPIMSETYDFATMVRLVSAIELALTQKDIPAVISGEDETNGLNWFLG